MKKSLILSLASICIAATGYAAPKIDCISEIAAGSVEQIALDYFSDSVEKLDLIATDKSAFEGFTCGTIVDEYHCGIGNCYALVPGKKDAKLVLSQYKTYDAGTVSAKDLPGFIRKAAKSGMLLEIVKVDGSKYAILVKGKTSSSPFVNAAQPALQQVISDAALKLP